MYLKTCISHVIFMYFSCILTKDSFVINVFLMYFKKDIFFINVFLMYFLA